MLHRPLLAVVAAFVVSSAATAAAAGEEARLTEDFERTDVAAVPATCNGDSLKAWGWSAGVVDDVAKSGSRSLHVVASRGGRDRALTWTIDATPFRDSVIAVRLAAKGAQDGTPPTFTLTVQRPGHLNTFDGALDVPSLDDKGWATESIEAGVAPDATSIVLSYRGSRSAKTECWIDDIVVERVAAASERPYELQLMPASAMRAANVHAFALRSEKLSSFAGRDIGLHAAVITPKQPEAGVDLSTLPICYVVHGFGGDHTMAWTFWPMLSSTFDDGGANVLYVMLDASCPLGHHEFADSRNNGPYGAALVDELIPALEKQYGGVRPASKRFVTGHSSGGWCALWLEVNYPDTFGACWATSPDPVDFRDWSGVNLYEAMNVFTDEQGNARPLVMQGSTVRQTIPDFVREEMAVAEQGGQMASFDAVFSPRGADGKPKRMFDRTTGGIDRDVVEAWKRYDIGLVLRTRWSELGPKLKGKLHVWVGDEDTFRLQGAVKLLKKDLAELQSDADVLIVPGRDHGSIFAPHPEYWPKGMMERIHREIVERAKR